MVVLLFSTVNMHLQELQTVLEDHGDPWDPAKINACPYMPSFVFLYRQNILGQNFKIMKQ